MRLAVCSTLLALAALSVAGSGFAQTGVPGTKTGLSLTPYLGVLIPTKDLLSFQNGTVAEVTKVSIGFVVGGRLGIGLGRRIAIEGDVGYSPGSLDIAMGSGTQGTTAFNQDVTTLTGSGKVTFYLIPRTSPFWIGVNGGAGAVRHKLKAGGAAEQAGLKGGTDVKKPDYLATIDVDPTSKTYSQILPNGKAYRFYFLQEVKSFISSPSPGLTLKQPGIYEITGVAYSGTGRIAKVMVSADGGQSWAEAALQTPVLPKAFTRFRMPWRWDGGPAVLQSRAWDEAGNAQPTRAQFVAARGETSKPPSVLGFPSQHFNAITSWAVDPKGEIKHVYA